MIGLPELGPPTQNLGADDDLFLDLNSGRIYRKIKGSWVNSGLLRAGALGRGPGWLSGSGSPTQNLGDEGDMYLDIASGRAFKKTSGTWLFLADLKGPKGDEGPAGELPQANCGAGQFVREISGAGQVACGTLSEIDPQVGATTNGRWCRGTGATITCDQAEPTSGLPSGCNTGDLVRWNGTVWMCSKN